MIQIYSKQDQRTAPSWSEDADKKKITAHISAVLKNQINQNTKRVSVKLNLTGDDCICI